MLDQPLSRRLRAIREAQDGPATDSAPTPPPPEAPRRVPLGELLVEKEVLSEADLDLALAQQREDGRPLGQILLAMGVVTQHDLARTLTEQHGFDFSASLRRRLAPVEEPGPEDEPMEEPPNAEGYLVREPGSADPLHVAVTFLDAADAAFELIEDREPERLEIVRSRHGELEHLWAYRREDAGKQPQGDAAA